MSLRDPRAQVFVLAFLALAIFLGRPRGHGLPSFDDAYYAQKAVEQLESGGSWVSTHGGHPRYDNPPLHFWVTAGLYCLFGVSRATAVLATGLFATGTVLLTLAFGRALFGAGPTGAVAGLILVLPGFFMDYARRGMLDQTLVFFTTLALLALWRAGDRGLSRWHLVWGLALGAALLTKSVIGALAMPVAGLALLTGRPRRLLAPGFWLGVLLGLGLFGLWVLQNARFGGRAFWDEHFAWLILSRAVHDAGAEGYGYLLGYLRLLWGNFWPWLPFAAGGIALALRERRASRPRSALLLCWALLPLAIMSLTRNQFLRYVLLIWPALALLSAHALTALLARRGWEWRGLGVLLALALVTAAAVDFTPLTLPGAMGLSRHSEDVIALAPAVESECPAGDTLLNFRLATWEPRNALLFATGRWLGDPVADVPALADSLAATPGRRLLTNGAGAARLDSLAPGLTRDLARAGNLVLRAGRSQDSR